MLSFDSLKSDIFLTFNLDRTNKTSKTPFSSRTVNKWMNGQLFRSAGSKIHPNGRSLRVLSPRTEKIVIN